MCRSYLVCPQFEEHPHAPIRRTFKVALRNLIVQCIDHADNKNPLLLDQKEKMLEADHPWHKRFARFSVQEAQHGLLEDLEDLMPALQWHLRLKDAGLMVRGYRLLYREGVARKRLPPKHLFTGQAEAAEVADASDQSAPETVSDLHELTAIAAIDADQEDMTETDGERAAELPTRSRRYGVGKEIGYATYVHRQYEHVLGETVAWAKRHLPEHFSYTVVKLNGRTDAVSFIDCPGFDSEDEPVIAAIIVVSADATVQRRNLPADPYIYHHKWLFVDDDYPGFDVAASKKRSRQWIGLGRVDRSRIGRLSYWRDVVVPQLDERG